ncbi:MAG: hypothetical protein Q9213_000505 [Squamulea squamosa]
MTEPSYGSPSRYIGKSPNPRDQPNRTPRPAGLAFSSIGEETRPDDKAGPKSAPANVKSFDHRASNENLRPWSQEDFDNRWHLGPEEMYVLVLLCDAVSKSLSDEYVLSPASASNSTSRRTTSSHLDLLEAQLKYSGTQPNSLVRNGMTPVAIGGAGSRTAPAPFNGRGYDDLVRYVAVAQSSQQCSTVPELERLMSTMLSLRGDGNVLLSVDRSGRDVVRRYMYEQIFDSDDGSSRFLQEDGKGMINVAGELMTREGLHHQIMFFLEDKLEEMVKSPSPQASPRQANVPSDPSNRQYSVVQHPATAGINATGSRPYDLENSTTGRQQGSTGRASAIPSFIPDALRPTQYYGSPPIHDLGALSLGEPQGDTREDWQVSGRAEASTLDRSVYPQESLGIRPSLSHGPQSSPYSPQPIGMGPQQPNGPFPHQFVSPPGMFYSPPYMPPQVVPAGYYHGSQAIPQAGHMVPYGAPYLRMPQHGSPMGPSPLVPNHQIVMNPFHPQWAHGPSYITHTSPAPFHQVPSYLGSVYSSTNRAQSPLVRNTDSPLQARPGRQVVPEVALLPYRPGSDDMFPYGQQGGSVQFQELTRNGGPTYESATKLEVLPFTENARKSKPAEWGVLRIGNIPYTLTKQEVLGFLGRNAKIITPEYGVAVHIIMDRPTGKTMDCYVEFFSQGDAQAALNKCLMRGSQLRLGERVVDVHMSSQDELLKELFPRAKNCTWEHGRPQITESTEPYNTGFKTFVTNEELLQTVTWADKPHRSNYTQKCLQRPYECMISTLAKFPWFSVDRYTIKTRDELFRSTLSLVNILMNQLNRANEAYLPHISETLLNDLLYAGLNVPAFSEQQRWHLRKAASTVGAKVRMSPMAEVWPFEVLGRKVGVDEDVVQKYAQILQSHPANTSKDTAFGEWTAISNEALGLQTIGQIGTHEMEMLLSMLRDVLPSSL